MLTDNPEAPLILVVEDDDNHAELIQRSFADAAEEYRLEVIPGYNRAMSAMEVQSPAIVLTDFRLPDGHGSDLVAMACGRWPVVMMTSHGNEQIAVEAMKIGAQDYIVKSPEAFESLPRSVNFVLMTWALSLARRQAAETDLRAKMDWERTFDAVPDLIAIIDIHHTITRVNKAMADRCGLTAEELVGRKCYEVVHGLHDAPFCCPASSLIQDGAVHNKEVEEKSLNGVFDVTVSPLTEESGHVTAWVHVMRDITERKNAEKERQDLLQQFQQAQKLESLGVLAGGIAHDFNNILTIILGHCFMVKEGVESGITTKSHVEQIEGAASRAADLCRQMLAYAGKSPMLKAQINLWLLVDEMVKMLQSAIKKNVVIQLDLKRDVPAISGDNSQIQQVVMNLIINAAESIGDQNGSVKVVLDKTIIRAAHPEIDFMGTVIPPRSYARLEVSDTGCGVDEDTKKRMFEPFFTTKLTGRGLGMSAVLGIIKSHDGALQLASSLGAGTTFKVYFPLPDQDGAVESEGEAGQLSSGLAGGTILLVDDEEALRAIGSVLLNAIGFATKTAANGREAIKIYREYGRDIDLVLLDFVMPEMGGVETYHLLRQISPALPIVFCTGYSNEIIPDDMALDEHTIFIQKPYKLDQLRGAITNLLGPAC